MKEESDPKRSPGTSTKKKERDRAGKGTSGNRRKREGAKP